MTDIIKKIGQLFVISCKGKTPSKLMLNFIHEEDIGGVILFKDNCESHLETKNNIDLIKSASKSTPLIAVDQEGGRVCRVTGAPAEIPSAWEYGTILGLEKYSEDYNRCIILLESLGINLNLAPVVDLFLNKKNKCLESRCFGDEIDKVMPFIEKSIQISKRHGLISCAKHFPGLGAAEIDPHENIAEADYDNILWEQREKQIYSNVINAGVDIIMTTHLLLKNIDNQIVTGSKKIINEMLRDMLNFDGPVITDDLTMQGAKVLGHIGERTVAAFNAGHDLLLFGQDLEASMEAYDYFREACLRNEISKDRLHAALDRVAGLKFKLGKSILL